MRKPIPRMMWQTSVSAVTTYLECARSYYYKYINKGSEPSKTNYYLLMGLVVHGMVRKFHKDGTPEKPFFYVDVEAAKGAFRGRWYNIVKANKERLTEVNHRKYRELKEAGQVCIENYWNLMFLLHEEGRGNPKYVEEFLRHYSQTYEVGINGRPDQIRVIPEKKIKRWNPDVLDSHGRLKPGYLPHVIVDLKTGNHNYTFKDKQNGQLSEGSLRLLARRQFAYQESKQATGYTYLHHRVYGGLPIAFAFYYLRTNEIFPTHRVPEDFPDLFEQVLHLRDNLESESFPKNEGKRCEYCEHIVRCRGDRDLVFINPLKDAGDFVDPLVVVPAMERLPEPKQLDLGFKVPRRKRKKNK